MVAISYFQYGEDENYINNAIYHIFKIEIVLNQIIFHNREKRIKSLNFINKKNIIIKHSKAISR